MTFLLVLPHDSPWRRSAWTGSHDPARFEVSSDRSPLALLMGDPGIADDSFSGFLEVLGGWREARPRCAPIEVARGRPAVSGVRPAVLEVRLVVLEVRPVVLGVRPVVLGVRPAVLGVRPAVLGVRPVVLGARPVVLGARPVVLGVRPAVLGARPAVLGARPAVLGARPAVLGARPAVLRPRSTVERDGPGSTSHKFPPAKLLAGSARRRGYKFPLANLIGLSRHDFTNP